MSRVLAPPTSTLIRGKHLGGWVTGRSLRFLADMALFPLMLRRRLTGISATLLVAWIASLNIVWQFPFLGLYSATFSILVVAAMVNTAMRPAIAVETTVPRTAVAGGPVQVRLRLQNLRRVPALQLRVALEEGPRARHAMTDAIGSLAVLNGESQTLHCEVPALVRGRRAIPHVQVISDFPFGVWRTFWTAKNRASVLVTPNPILDDAPEHIGRLRAAALDWIDARREEDASEYAGSREYVIGQSVRQWDYRAWSRLNRPMVRIAPRARGGQTTLILDPFVPHADDHGGPQYGRTRDRILNDDVEWMLRLAAAVVQRAGASMAMDVVIAGPQPALKRYQKRHGVDVPPLVQMALAAEYPADVPSLRTGDPSLTILESMTLERARRGEALILTTRSDLRPLHQLAIRCKILSICHPHSGQVLA